MHVCLESLTGPWTPDKFPRGKARETHRKSSLGIAGNALGKTGVCPSQITQALQTASGKIKFKCWDTNTWDDRSLALFSRDFLWGCLTLLWMLVLLSYNYRSVGLPKILPQYHTIFSIFVRDLANCHIPYSERVVVYDQFLTPNHTFESFSFFHFI